MARTKLTEELKKAVTRMPVGEKDKLLLRLLVKDEKLVSQLEFQLLEGGTTRELRRDNVRMEIRTTLEKYTIHYVSPGHLLLFIRALSGDISRHVSATKDKYGEVELNFYLLNQVFEIYGNQIRKASLRNALTLNEYIVKKALRLFTLLTKIHEDLHLDFFEAMKQLGGHILETESTRQAAMFHKLNVDHLLDGTIG